MPSFEMQLAELDRLISAFAGYVRDYPSNTPYAESLTRLRRERAELASKIGKKR